MTRSSSGVWHAWVGLEPDPELAAKIAVSGDTLVVHGHGKNGVLDADPAQLSAAVRASGATQVLLLVCEQTYAQQFATHNKIDTWATPDGLFVNTLDGSVFIGHGDVDSAGRLRITDTKLSTLQKFTPGGAEPLADPGPSPLDPITIDQARAKSLGPWQRRGWLTPPLDLTGVSDPAQLWRTATGLTTWLGELATVLPDSLRAGFEAELAGLGTAVARLLRRGVAGDWVALSSAEVAKAHQVIVALDAKWPQLSARVPGGDHLGVRSRLLELFDATEQQIRASPITPTETARIDVLSRTVDVWRQNAGAIGPPTMAEDTSRIADFHRQAMEDPLDVRHRMGWPGQQDHGASVSQASATTESPGETPVALSQTQLDDRRAIFSDNQGWLRFVSGERLDDGVHLFVVDAPGNLYVSLPLDGLHGGFTHASLRAGSGRPITMEGMIETIGGRVVRISSTSDQGILAYLESEGKSRLFLPQTLAEALASDYDIVADLIRPKFSPVPFVPAVDAGRRLGTIPTGDEGDPNRLNAEFIRFFSAEQRERRRGASARGAAFPDRSHAVALDRTCGHGFVWESLCVVAFGHVLCGAGRGRVARTHRVGGQA